jgi:hypothetical protein
MLAALHAFLMTFERLPIAADTRKLLHCTPAKLAEGSANG